MFSVSDFIILCVKKHLFELNLFLPLSVSLCHLTIFHIPVSLRWDLLMGFFAKKHDFIGLPENETTRQEFIPLPCLLIKEYDR